MPPSRRLTGDHSADHLIRQECTYFADHQHAKYVRPAGSVPEPPEDDMAAVPLAERWYRRHAALVRITHWINVVCFTLLLMSGLQIFNAHPALYVGERSDFDHPALSIQARPSENGFVGETVILGHSFDTTGVLGVSSENGQVSARAFPSWITIPSSQDLAPGRRWHCAGRMRSLPRAASTMTSPALCRVFLWR